MSQHRAGSQRLLVMSCGALVAIALAGAPGCASTERRLTTVTRDDDGPATPPGPVACEEDRDCPAGQTCVADCQAAVRSVAGRIAQTAAPCPGFCRADADDADGGDGPDGDGDEDDGSDRADAADDGVGDEPVVMLRPRVTPPARPRVMPPAKERWLLPAEETVTGDAKLESALEEVTGLTREVASAVRGASGCAARVQAFIDWAAANRARASRLGYRVRLLSARRNYDYTEAEKAGVRRHEAAYEVFGQALLDVCDEDGPELARLETMDDVMLPPTFHRLPEEDPFEASARCVGWRELRLRALIDPPTLRGAAGDGGRHVTTVTVKDMTCEVSGAGTAGVEVTCRDALGAAPDGYALRWGYHAHEPMGTWQGHLAKLATRCMTGDYAYSYERKTDGELTILTAAEEQPHVVMIGPLPGHGGRFVWSLTARR